MKKFSNEIKHLASVPCVLYSLIRDFFVAESEERQRLPECDDRRIILDRDGNITLNLNSPSVKEEMRQHFVEMKKVKIPQQS